MILTSNISYCKTDVKNNETMYDECLKAQNMSTECDMNSTIMRKKHPHLWL